MFHDSLTRYLESRGLSPSDIPPVLTNFLILKQSTYLASVLIGLRYRPLSRVFKRVRTRGTREVERRGRIERDKLSTGSPRTIIGGVAARIQGAKKDFRLGRESSEMSEVARPAETMLERLGRVYERQAKVLQGRLGESEVLRSVARRTGQDPAGIAIGFVEGSMMYKITFPITGPICLYTVVRARRTYLGKEAKKDKTGMELLGECSDIVDLSDEEGDEDDGGEEDKDEGEKKESKK